MTVGSAPLPAVGRHAHDRRPRRAAARAPTRARVAATVPLSLRALWFLAVAVALPAWAHWGSVVGEFDLAAMQALTPARFLGYLAFGAAVWLTVAVLPWSLLLRWRRRRRGPRRYDRAVAAALSGAALLLALHGNLTAFAGFYGNTWARWEATFGFFVPQWPAISLCLAATVALELCWPARAVPSPGSRTTSL